MFRYDNDSVFVIPLQETRMKTQNKVYHLLIVVFKRFIYFYSVHICLPASMWM